MKGLCLDDTTYDLDVNVTTNSLGQITSGLVVGETMYQNEALILISHKGDIKEYPLLGVGIDDMVNDNDIAAWESEIRVNLADDNMQVHSAKINRTTGNITIEAEYE